jgi:nucleotide-binding universal stress UspA family protein
MNDDRYILVIADKTQEMSTALEYACARSKKTGRKIIIATFIVPLDVLTTQGVAEIMKNEAREEAEKILYNAASIVKESTGTMPILQTREGEAIKELKKLIEEEENINVLVLAANANEAEKNPGPIINALMAKEISTLRIPVMIVPGNFSKEHISQIT